MIENNPNAEWLAQVRRGLLEWCVLTLVTGEARYGYDLLTALGRWPQLAVTEGTLYPLLRRLERDGSLAATWRESDAGPPRKYYQLTPAGARRQASLAREWAQLTRAVEELASAHDQRPVTACAGERLGESGREHV